MTARNVGATWTQMSGVSLGIQGGVNVLIRVGIAGANAGECVVIDDVSLLLL